MIDLHYWTTPNGHKITMFLEETGLPYKVFPVNIGKGDQFKPEFLAIAPNNRMPAIVDHEPKGGGKPISIFESGAILLYLAEKTGKLLPADLYAAAWLDPSSATLMKVFEHLRTLQRILYSHVPRQVALVSKPCRERHLRNRQAPILQQQLRALDASTQHVLMHRHAGRLPEQRLQMRHADASH